jgi:hypothetical protein
MRTSKMAMRKVRPRVGGSAFWGAMLWWAGCGGHALTVDAGEDAARAAVDAADSSKVAESADMAPDARPPDSTPPDGVGSTDSRDAGPDTRLDGAVDAGGDAAADAPPDAATEARTDASAGGEVAVDAPADAPDDVVAHGLFPQVACPTDGGPSPRCGYCGARCPDRTPTYGRAFTLQTAETTTAIAIGLDGALFVGGAFSERADFDPGPGTDVRVPVGMADAFVTKLNPDGSYAWTLTFGGAGAQMGVLALAVGLDAVSVSGWYGANVDFDPGPGVVTRPTGPDAGSPGFVARFGFDRQLQWVDTFVGTTDCSVRSLAFDDAGAVYAGGAFSSLCDLDPGPDVDERLAESGGENGFLVKLAGDDGRRLWGRAYAGKDCQGYVAGIGVGADGTVWTTGTVTDGCSFGGAALPTGVDSGGLVAAFSPGGTPRGLWKLAGSITGNAVAVAPGGAVYVVGYALGAPDFDPGPGIVLRQLPTDDHFPTGFVLKLGADARFKWVQTFAVAPVVAVGAVGDDGVVAVGLPPPDLVPAPGILVTKLHDDGSPSWSFRLGDSNMSIDAVAIGAASFAASGEAYESGDLDPGPGTDLVPRQTTFVSRYAF